jgi:hypothetical protein
MTFLNPAAFLLLLTIPVVVLFHLLKIRRQQAVISSTLFWADSLRDQQATAPFRRLKPNLILLLQLLGILFLALAGMGAGNYYGLDRTLGERFPAWFRTRFMSGDPNPPAAAMAGVRG